ncbi:uncharacterized protein LOC124155789 [Ischnura elegans]|uniref:uncharacterized protein LOC124155789 n=1 Tax=Ischnura elegans TaxID=197161 RepID=UPI001ED8AD0C|nr:uncharacterized protein LOC124155789 [Ischnura elegans]
MESKKKWEPAVQIKPKDSLHTKTKYHKPFLPSYEKKEPEMYALMCMEYRRLWYKEREDWEECVYTQKDNLKQTKSSGSPSDSSPKKKQILLRSYVKRKPMKKRSPAEDFTMKRFKNIPGTMRLTITPKSKMTKEK